MRRGGQADVRRIGAAESVMAKRSPKPKPVLSSEALEILALRFRALGDATRLALLQALFTQERTVQELGAVTGTSQANTSKHLAVLLERGLVARRRAGLFVYYRIADASLEKLCRVVCGSLAERHEAVRASLAS